MNVLIILAACLLNGALAGPHKAVVTRYDRYQVLQITPNTEDDVRTLMAWQIQHIELDFWDTTGQPGDSADIMVPPSKVEWLTNEAKSLGMDVQVKIDNVQRDVDIEDARLNARFLRKKAYDINDFNTFDDIVSELNNLARNHCPSGFECDVYSIGQTDEGRELWVISIMDPMGIKQSQWIDSTIHAREWIAPATLMNFIDFMMKGYGSDNQATEMLNLHDWYFMPVVNPDGYVFSWTNTRMWRKNRRRFGSCYGVDINRNFDFRWATGGVSTNPCSEIFCGPSGASEPEIVAQQQELNRLGSGLGTNMIGLTTIHSYGNMFMHSWGYKTNGRCTRSADHDKLYRVAEAAANAIMGTYNTRWTYGNSCEVIYETTGSTEDYAKAISGVEYTFCPELRGSSFIVNKSQIRPSSEEFKNGIYAMVKQIEREIRG